MDILDTARVRLRGRGAKVVFPEGADERIVAAAQRLSAEQIAVPIVLGNGPLQHLDRYAALYREGRPDASEAIARRLAAKPLFHAGLMVKAGDADAMIAGVANPTARVIEAGMMTIGLTPGITTPSSFFLIALPGRLLIYADCAVNADPSAEALADIAVASAASARHLLHEPPRVAMLSFSNFGSTRHPLSDKVRKAVEMVRERAPGLMIDGEMQADTAVVPHIIDETYPFSTLKGGANVLIFPNLEAGNIAYKLLQRIGGAELIGPLLTGLSKPVHVLQRGSEVNDIVHVAAVAVVDAQEIGKPYRTLQNTVTR